MSTTATAQTRPSCLRKAEACRRLGIDSSAVNRLIALGQLKTIPKIPGMGTAIILESSVNELIARMNGDQQQAS